MQCIICQSMRLEKLNTTNVESFVSSGRKKTDRGGVRVVCRDCGTIQFLRNQEYRDIVNEVLENFDVLHDKVWAAETGMPTPRLQVIFEKIHDAIQLPEKGNMLDIGCGGGEALSCFNRLYPQWNLYGMDIGKQFRDEVLERERVKQFFSSLEEVKSANVKFDFVTINDVLNVADNCVQILEIVYELLTDEGILFVKDVDFEVHPWLIFLIETSTLYTKNHMKAVISNFGFEVLDIDVGLEEKEIAIFCRRNERREPEFLLNGYEANVDIYRRNIVFLNGIIDTVQKYLKQQIKIGIFGTSIAGVWLAGIITKESSFCLERKIFYIEEDEEALQKGTGAYGYPIYQLEDVTETAVVFLPFPKYMAESILKRCEPRYKHLKFLVFE